MRREGEPRDESLLIYRLGRYRYGDFLSQRAVDAVFQAMFLLTDIRALLRETAPDHLLDDEQKQQAARTLEKVQKQISILEKELVR
jgi:hypothetical protein